VSCGITIAQLQAIVEEGGEGAQGAEATLIALKNHAVQRLMHAIIDEAEAERLDHIGDPEWQEAHRDDPAQKLRREFSSGIREDEAQKQRDFETQCQTLEEYQNPPEDLDLMSIPYDETDPYCQLNEIGFLARKTGQMEFLTRAEELMDAFDAAIDDPAQSDEEFDRRERDFWAFTRAAKSKLCLSLLQQRARFAAATTVLYCLTAHVHNRVRAYRSPSRLRRVTADSGGDDDPDSADSDPPRHRHSAIHSKYNPNSLISPWPSHGCCRVERRRAS
jgi:hypothetical protein